MSKLSKMIMAIERAVDRLTVSYLLLRSEFTSSDDNSVRLDHLQDDILRKLIESMDDDEVIKLCETSKKILGLVDADRLARIKRRRNVTRWIEGTNTHAITYKRTNPLANNRAHGGWKLGYYHKHFLIMDSNNKVLHLRLEQGLPTGDHGEIYRLTEDIQTKRQLSALISEHILPDESTNQLFRISLYNEEDVCPTAPTPQDGCTSVDVSQWLRNNSQDQPVEDFRVFMTQYNAHAPNNWQFRYLYNSYLRKPRKGPIIPNILNFVSVKGAIIFTGSTIEIHYFLSVGMEGNKWWSGYGRMQNLSQTVETLENLSNMTYDQWKSAGNLLIVYQEGHDDNLTKNVYPFP